MGVWIETTIVDSSRKARGVTPCMGVWIETQYICRNSRRDQSHPVWVCGLKPECVKEIGDADGHTLYGCVD